jgi:uncharacterized NAD(P)/FAD-binding protein YdhS/predicted metal-dependent enzyme (double-stranded beta helix superfamily)
MQGYQRILELFDTWDSRATTIPFSEMVEALRGLELERADLAGALVFAERNYRRIAIRRSPHYEALILCWKSGQRSPIHNHLGSSCVVRVVEGRATETSFVRSPCGKLVPQRSRSFAAGSVTGCKDEAVHQMANLEPPGHDLITLHLYSPPPSQWNYFSLDVTTLADHDRLLHDRPETVVVDFGQAMPIAPVGANIEFIDSATSPGATPTIAIIGAGFSGAMVAVHLARLAKDDAPRIVLFEKGERLARGVAYGTHCEQHLLNVPAGAMSALADEPSHFLDWLRERDPSAHAATFAPRKVYGEYLDNLLNQSKKSSRASIEIMRDEVVELEASDASQCIQLITRENARVEASSVVLALGHPLPEEPRDFEIARLGRGFVSNPWSPDALAELDANDPIAIIGTGLTAVDLFVEAHARGHRGTIFAISRHGLLPCRHQTPSAIPRPHIPISAGPGATARGLLKRVRTEVAVCQAQGNDWRTVVDSLRPVTQTLWRSLADTERSRFIRHLAPRWDVHRHRVAPQIDDLLQEASRSGRLVVVAGRLLSMTEIDGMIDVSYRRRGAPEPETLRVRRVINCTGPARDVRAGSSRLLRSLIDRGIGRPGPLALGLDVADSGALIGADGCEHKRLFAIGPLLKERLWETTAVRELRIQTLELARRLLQESLA